MGGAEQSHYSSPQIDERQDRNMKKSGFHKYFWLLFFLVFTIGLYGTIPAQSSQEKDPSAPIENLTFQAAEIRSVIRFLADYGKVNVVVAPKVQGTVTINLTNVTWQQALNIIGQTYELAVVFEEDGYIRIMPADDYRKEKTAIDEHNMQQVNLAQLDVQVVHLANTAATEIVESVKSLMTERGKVNADQRTNSLIIQEIPDNMIRVVEFIKQLDRPARQIKISTQMLELYSNDGLELGVDWSIRGTYTSNSGNTIDQGLEQVGNQVTDPFITYDIGMMMHGWSADAMVSAIVSDGKGKVIAHPEITTIENSEARIQMGQKVPVKQFDQSGNVVIQFEEVGTILKVTPHITAENQILMHLRPERSNVEPSASGIIINTSNAETNVVVNNGQTAVIGGLTSQIEVEATKGIPVLKDIPLIGNLFKYTQRSYEDRDLVIFVTPTIVDTELADTGP
jgi:type IV pilus assembly protein PilQ